MILKGIEIKPGMVVKTQHATYVAFPIGIPDTPIAFANLTAGGWTLFLFDGCIQEIYNLPMERVIDSGELLWKKEWDREITMAEIAEKFGIPENRIRIKE